jgi:hypothetical protein
MLKQVLPVVVALTLTSGAWAGQIWNSTFGGVGSPDPNGGVVDAYDGNPSKAMIGTPVGNQLPLTVQDSTSFGQTDRSGRPLGFTLDGHAEYSGYMDFNVGSLPPTGQTWTTLGFSSGPPGVPSNPGIARQVSCAFLIWNHNGAGDVTLNLGLQWASSSGQDRNKIVSLGVIGSDAQIVGRRFQLAIGYQGDVNGNTNTVDPGTGTMTVRLYDRGGVLITSVFQGNTTAGDGGGQSPLLTGLGGEPGIYPTFLSNQQLSYFGAMDYVATLSGRNVTYLMNSMSWYDSFGDAFNAVSVPEPASMVLLAAGGLLLCRRQRAC